MNRWTECWDELLAIWPLLVPLVALLVLAYLYDRAMKRNLESYLEARKALLGHIYGTIDGWKQEPSERKGKTDGA